MFNINTDEGLVNIVRKESADDPKSEICYDESGQGWVRTNSGSGPFTRWYPPVAEDDSPEDGDLDIEVAFDPATGQADGDDPDEPAAESTDDDPLGNPLDDPAAPEDGADGVAASTAEGVASGDPVPPDAEPVQPVRIGNSF